MAQVLGGIQSKGMDMNTQPDGFVTQIKPDQTNEITGNVYLYEQWFEGTIEFINEAKISSKSIRYNVKSDLVEIQNDDIVRGAQGKNIKSFEIFNTHTQCTEKYVRVNDFLIGNTRLVGFLRVLQAGYYSLFSKTDIKLVKGVYVAALDMGDENDRYVRSTTYYWSREKVLIELPNKRKQFAALFPEGQKEILTYIKDQQLSLKVESDLIQIFSYINSVAQF